MDSSGRTTQRQYYVGRGRPNTNSADHLGVSEKWEDRMERKRELLLVSCKIKEEENKKPTPNTRWKSVPGWEGALWTDSHRAQTMRSYPTARMTITGDHSPWAKDAERPKSKKKWPLCIQHKGEANRLRSWMAEQKVCLAETSFPGSLSCGWWESFPSFMPSTWLLGCYTQQWLESVINSLLPLEPRESLNCGAKYKCGRYRCV